MMRYLFYFAAIGFFLACHDERLKPDDQINPADLFSLAIDTAHHAHANDLEFYTVSVTFKSDVLQEKRKVVLSTDIGLFSNRKKSIEVIANQSLTATAFLSSDSVGSGSIKAVVADKFEIEHPVKFYTSSAVFSTRFDTLRVQADGISSASIKVTFADFVPIQNQKIKITSSRGVFSNRDKSIELLANTNREASTWLTSEEIGAARIQFIYDGKVGSEDNVQFVAPSPDFQFISNVDIVIPADNDSVHRVEVQFLKFLTLADRSISLETTLGTFSNGLDKIDILSNSDNKAVAFLKSAKAGQATIKGTFKQKYSEEIVLTFKNANPEFMKVTSPQFSLKSGLDNSVHLTTRLMRNFGTPSSGFNVSYTAVDSAGKPVGLFINNVPSDGEGNATVDYSAGPAKTQSNSSTYRGRVKIRGQLKLAPTNKTLRDSLEIFVTD